MTVRSSNVQPDMSVKNVSRVVHVYAGVSCRPMEALVDTAAEDAVIGERAMQRLRKELQTKGLQPLPVGSGVPFPGAGGIGGPAQVVAMLEVPVGVAQVNGVLRFTVLKDSEDSETPPLLPIKYLESVGAILDFSQDVYRTQLGPETSMRRLPSEHRATNILEFDSAGWDLPLELRKDPKVDPFVLRSENYMHRDDSILVWLVQGGELQYVETPPGPRSSLVTPFECSSLQPHQVSTVRTTHLVEAEDPAQQHLEASSRPRPLWHGSVVFHSREDAESFQGGGVQQSTVSTSSASSASASTTGVQHSTVSTSSASSAASPPLGSKDLPHQQSTTESHKCNGSKGVKGATTKITSVSTRTLMNPNDQLLNVTAESGTQRARVWKKTSQQSTTGMCRFA